MSITVVPSFGAAPRCLSLPISESISYRLMLAICSLLLPRQIPTQTADANYLPEIARELLVFWRGFETFVVNFYRCHLV
jgi:hypothetical protein